MMKKEEMKQQIVDIVKEYAEGNYHLDITEHDLHIAADRIVKLFAIPDVVRSTAPLLIKGRYNEEMNYVDDNGNQLCEWCESKNITDPVPDTMNGICHDCGSHW